MTAPRFSDSALEAIANEFTEVLRVKHDAEAKLVELFDKFTEESVGYGQRSDQESRAITEEIEAMRAVIATRTEPAQKGPLEPGADITAPARPPHLLPYFEDVDSGYLHWVLLNIDNDQVRATARYHLDLRAAREALRNQRLGISAEADPAPLGDAVTLEQYLCIRPLPSDSPPQEPR